MKTSWTSFLIEIFISWIFCGTEGGGEPEVLSKNTKTTWEDPVIFVFSNKLKNSHVRPVHTSIFLLL